MPPHPNSPASPTNAPPPELLARAYLAGAFPMADSITGEVGWYSPDPRAVQPFVEGDPLGKFNVRRSLAKRVRNAGYTITRSRALAQVIAACAQPRPNEPETWISPALMQSYIALHGLGLAHSVECWHDGQLVGGLYGVAIGGAFFGESMFSRMPDASQVALVHLVKHLRSRGYTLLDVQFVNPHIEQFGVVEIRRDHFLRLLEDAVQLPVTWEDEEGR